MSDSRIYRTWVDRFTGDERPSRAIQNQAAKVIWPLANGQPPSGHRTALTADEAVRLFNIFHDRINERPILVPDDQAAIGRRWLTDMARRKRLPDADYASIREFAWVGCDVVSSTWYRTLYAPTYAGALANGDVVRYTPTAWQASAYGARADENPVPFLVGTILLADDGRGYTLTYSNGRYQAGCRDFAYDEAVDHWSSPWHPAPQSAGRLLAAVETHHATLTREVAA